MRFASSGDVEALRTELEAIVKAWCEMKGS
jgi:hypothetical protein